MSLPVRSKGLLYPDKRQKLFEHQNQINKTLDDPALAGIPNLKYNEWNNPLLPLFGGRSQQNSPQYNYFPATNGYYSQNTVTNNNYGNLNGQLPYYQSSQRLNGQNHFENLRNLQENLVNNENLATNSIQFEQKFSPKFRRISNRSRVESRALPQSYRNLSQQSTVRRPRLKLNRNR